MGASHDHPGTLCGCVAASALADGAHGHRDAVHRRRHGRFGLSTLRPSGSRSIGRSELRSWCCASRGSSTASSIRRQILPDTVPSLQRFAAKASHIVLYSLMLTMPLVGWGMMSAERYPIVLYGPLRLPPILPHDLTPYAWLRDLHTGLAYLLFATFLVHFGAALYHGPHPPRRRVREHGIVSASPSCCMPRDFPSDPYRRWK